MLDEIMVERFREFDQRDRGQDVVHVLYPCQLLDVCENTRKVAQQMIEKAKVEQDATGIIVGLTKILALQDAFLHSQHIAEVYNRFIRQPGGGTRN